MKMNNKTYDVLKWIVMIVLPAFATFYAGLAELWNLPYATEIPSTDTLIATFLGAILMISSHNYNKSEEGENDDE